MNLLKWALALLPCTVLLSSCAEKPSAAGRISVTKPDGAIVSSAFIVPLEGESSSWNVQAEEDVDIFYKEASGTAEKWFTVTGISKNGPGNYTVSYSAKPRGNTLELRSGTMSFVAPGSYLGAFFSVQQGYKKIWEKSFGGEGLSILPGHSWTSDTMDGISSIQDAWLSFHAKADALPGGSGVYPVSVTLVGGAGFADINRSTYVVDLQAGENFGADSFHRLHIYNGGRVFSSESRVLFSVPSDLSTVIRIRDISIYEIPVAKDGISGISDSDADE